MKKISIVGVEGSGKTVLMSVLGERYARPDENGLSLKAKSAETFLFCSTAVAAMRKGEWPPATQPGEMTRLEWQLLRHRGSSEPKVIGELTMLDFAGEVYRQAFGLDQNHIDESYQDDVNRLRQYVIHSDVLMVLVNLKEVIDGDRTEKRTNELLWLSQRILDFAKEHRVKDVALVVSQTDRYEHIVLECGSVQEVLKRYLANTAYAFPHVPTFAVSAVDRTIFKKNGLEGPAEDFSSSGLSELMAWIKNRIASRRFLIKRLLYFFLSLGVVAGGAFFVIREKQRIDTMTQLKTKQLAGYVIEITDLGESSAKWKEGVEPPGNRNLVTLKDEGMYRSKRLGYEWVPGTLTERWKSGVRHEQNPEIVSSEKEGEWISTRSGYSPTEEFRLVWKPGLRHLTCDLLRSCVKEGDWECVRPGWKWIGGTNIEWQADVVHPNCDILKSSKKEDCWNCVKPGWKWVRDTNIVWEAGVIHPKNNELVSADIPDSWSSTKAGYCVDPETLEVTWKSGLVHSANENLISADREGTWRSKRPGYVWKEGTELDYWASGLKHPENENLISTENVGVWKSTRGEGWVWDGATGEKWEVGIESVEHPHWVTISTDEHPTGWWKPMPGYTRKDKDAKGLSELVWTPGVIDNGRKAAKKTDHWLDKCRLCKGEGKRDCWKCDGKGKIDCSICRGSGQKEEVKTERCQNCEGKGQVRQGCNDKESEWITIAYQNMHVRRCRTCKGSGGVLTQWGIEPCSCWPFGCTLCPVCGGDGIIDVSCKNCDNGYSTIRESDDCSNCSGRGKISCLEKKCINGKILCSECKGDGWEKE